MGWKLCVPEFTKEGHFEGAIVGTNAFCSAVVSLIKGESENIVYGDVELPDDAVNK
jgi:hypothetical protein